MSSCNAWVPETQIRMIARQSSLCPVSPVHVCLQPRRCAISSLCEVLIWDIPVVAQTHERQEISLGGVAVTSMVCSLLPPSCDVHLGAVL